MELNGLTVVYYYSYASLLAGMYLPRDDRRSHYCTESAELIRKIRSSSYGADQTIGEILNESESICRAMTSAGANATQSPTPTVTGTLRTPTPTPSRTPHRTPTPTPAALGS